MDDENVAADLGSALEDLENRCMILYVSQDDILSRVSQGIPVGAKTLCVSVLDGVPEDAHVVSVHHDYPRRSFAFTLRHPTFEPVPPGCVPPEVCGAFQREYLCVDLPEWWVEQRKQKEAASAAE